jgi:hypothetical protein
MSYPGKESDLDHRLVSRNRPDTSISSYRWPCCNISFSHRIKTRRQQQRQTSITGERPEAAGFNALKKDRAWKKQG